LCSELHAALRKPATKRGKAKEAPSLAARQRARVNYNNFICRLSAPRLSTATSTPPATKTAPKKARKPVRRRLAVVATAVCVILGGGASGLHAENSSESTSSVLRLIPASGTVPFNGGSPAAFSGERPRTVFDEPTLAARMDEFTAQVNALTTQAWQQVTPPSPARLSMMTVALLAAGCGVALFRARLLLRPDLVC
jgi:hypothetical protein